MYQNDITWYTYVIKLQFILLVVPLATFYYYILVVVKSARIAGPGGKLVWWLKVGLKVEPMLFLLITLLRKNLFELFKDYFHLLRSLASYAIQFSNKNGNDWLLIISPISSLLQSYLSPDDIILRLWYAMKIILFLILRSGDLYTKSIVS